MENTNVYFFLFYSNSKNRLTHRFVFYYNKLTHILILVANISVPCCYIFEVDTYLNLVSANNDKHFSHIIGKYRFWNIWNIISFWQILYIFVLLCRKIHFMISYCLQMRTNEVYVTKSYYSWLSVSLYQDISYSYYVWW